jgi:hypothetical protein
MSDATPVKGALLVAAIVTSIVAPLAMFVAYAPDGDEASGGFHQAQMTATSALAWAGIAAAIFVVTFAGAVMLVPRARR